MSFILPTKPQVGLRVGNFISLFMSHFLKNFTLCIDIINAVQMMFVQAYTVEAVSLALLCMSCLLFEKLLHVVFKGLDSIIPVICYCPHQFLQYCTLAL